MTIPVAFRDHFQNAYVVRNFDGASGMLRDRFGIAKWHVMRLPEGSPVSRIGLAYVQNLMIELIEAVPNQDSIYKDWIPKSDTAAKFHHHGFLIEREEDYQRTVEQFNAAGCPAAFAGSNGDMLDFHYADTVAQLGHYCELIHLKPAGREFFSVVPRN